MLLAETENWVRTWTDPSMQDIITTSLSLPHLIAEAFAGALEAIILYIPVRMFVRWHDRKHHPKDSHV